MSSRQWRTISPLSYISRCHCPCDSSVTRPHSYLKMEPGKLPETSVPQSLYSSLYSGAIIFTNSAEYKRWFPVRSDDRSSFADSARLIRPRLPVHRPRAHGVAERLWRAHQPRRHRLLTRYYVCGTVIDECDVQGGRFAGGEEDQCSPWGMKRSKAVKTVAVFAALH